MKTACTRILRWIIPLLILIMAIQPAASALQENMPFNGEIAFHLISIIIPENYVRDSTQSSEDLWIFEKGWYKKYIMLSRKDLNGETNIALNNYIEYLKGQGVDSRRDTFMGLEAVRSAQPHDDMPWHEMLFVHKGSLYAIAMRGGSEDELQALLDTVVIHDTPPEIAVPEDTRSPMDRILGYWFGK